MNKDKRKRLANICEELQAVLDEEKETYSSIPSNLENTDVFVASEEAIECMDDAVDFLESIVNR